MNIPGFAHWALTVALVASHGAVSAQTRPYPPTAQAGGQTLQLNGAGTRYRAVFAVYDVGLYVGRKVTTAEQVLSQPGTKRMAFVALRDTPADQLGLMLVRGMKANAPPQQAAVVAGYMGRLGQIFSTEQKIHAGESFSFEYVPNKGTVFILNGQQKGEIVTDPGFIDAMLRIWLGPQPVDERLKASLLGDTPKARDTSNLG